MTVVIICINTHTHSCSQDLQYTGKQVGLSNNLFSSMWSFYMDKHIFFVITQAVTWQIVYWPEID